MPAAEYLSGQVRVKLEQARAAAGLPGTWCPPRLSQPGRR